MRLSQLVIYRGSHGCKRSQRAQPAERELHPTADCGAERQVPAPSALLHCLLSAHTPSGTPSLLAIWITQPSIIQHPRAHCPHARAPRPHYHSILGKILHAAVSLRGLYISAVPANNIATYGPPAYYGTHNDCSPPSPAPVGGTLSHMHYFHSLQSSFTSLGIEYHLKICELRQMHFKAICPIPT